MGLRATRATTRHGTPIAEMPGLEAIEQFRPSLGVIDETIDLLRSAGRRGNEGFVLWSGVRDGRVFSVRRAHWPKQAPQRTSDGLLVYVDGSALHEVNKFCFAQGEIVGAQVHTHPTDAYHSDTDDHYPLVTLKGSLSVVIPDFAVDGWAGVNRWAWYRLAGHANWKRVDRSVLEVTDEHSPVLPEGGSCGGWRPWRRRRRRA